MFYLFSFGFIIVGIIAMVTGCDIFEVLGCFAVAALFHIAATIAFIAGKLGGKK